MRTVPACAFAFAMLIAAPALADKLAVTDAWARTTPPGATMGAVYFKLHNGSGKSDRLLELKTLVTASASVHRTEIVEGMTRMREVSVLQVAPGEKLAFEPGGLHVMLMGLKGPLKQGQVFELALLFEVAGPVKVRVTARRN
ncbi:MAG TPA: copper chaperone PCu(A)C [Steroidobacteraceae bacterium]|nr:copper chaperone PCu(A)C [Steroidobacteraceae bacterium]